MQDTEGVGVNGAQPVGKAATVTTPPRTYSCTHSNAQGAVCTSDDRKLSTRLELTVAGPQVSDPNSPATGAPTVSGTVQVGQTLTAQT